MTISLFSRNRYVYFLLITFCPRTEDKKLYELRGAPNKFE